MSCTIIIVFVTFSDPKLFSIRISVLSFEHPRSEQDSCTLVVCAYLIWWIESHPHICATNFSLLRSRSVHNLIIVFEYGV